MKSQKEKVARLLWSRYKKPVLNRELCSAGGYRFGGRIKELREDGWLILTQRVDVGLYSYTLLKVPTKNQLKLLGI